MTAMMDVFAGLSLAAQLQSSSPMTQPSRYMSQSMQIAKVETKQGMFKEYSVETTDDTSLDEIRRSYKTAEETDDGKTKVLFLEYLNCLFNITC